MADSVATLAKPQMRGLLHKQIKRNLITAFILVGGTGLAFHFLHNRPFKQRYAEFYREYDIDKEFNEMREKGLFDSCK